MAYLENITGLRSEDKVLVACDFCTKQKSILLITAKRSEKKNDGKYLCAGCAAKASLRPQNCKSYWDDVQKEKHSQAIKSSDKYYEAIKYRNTSGAKNSMYGKKHTAETKNKMSEVRRGKFGVNATAWKGGRSSLCCRVKGVLHKQYNWYKKVYMRDGWKCVKCNSNNKIDAHHKIPVIVLINQLLKNKSFCTEEEKLQWLITQPELVDLNLENGITLCRECHRKEHQNWGSHVNP